MNYFHVNDNVNVELFPRYDNVEIIQDEEITA